jgi:hypothetical protein
MKAKRQWQGVRVLHDLMNPAEKLEVQLGFPEPWENELWRCAYRVKGLDRSKISYGVGCDALQALTTALDGIARQLRESGRRFKWIDLAGESGIRRQIPIFLGSKFADEIESHIATKVDSFVQDRQNAVKSKVRVTKKRRTTT